MFKFCSLFSGSTGNSLFVETENSKILVDAGESAKKIVSALSLIGIEVTDIDAILVTHEHIDHVKSLGTLSKKYNIPVYANENTWNAIPIHAGIVYLSAGDIIGIRHGAVVADRTDQNENEADNALFWHFFLYDRNLGTEPDRCRTPDPVSGQS